MKVVEFADYLIWAEERRGALAAAGELLPDEALRNQGANRTEAKRELLRRIEARALAAGKTPVISHIGDGPERD